MYFCLKHPLPRGAVAGARVRSRLQAGRGVCHHVIVIVIVIVLNLTLSTTVLELVFSCGVVPTRGGQHTAHGCTI